MNTFVDDKVLIRQLRQENRQIKGELDLIKQEKEMMVALGQDEFDKCLRMVASCLDKDGQLNGILQSVEFGEQWTKYENQIVGEVAYQPLMAIACFNLFARVIQDKNKLIREGLRDTRKQAENQRQSEEDRKEEKKEGKGKTDEAEHKTRHKEADSNGQFGKEIKQKPEKLEEKKENLNKPKKRDSGTKNQISKVNQKENGQIKINEEIKTDKEKCLQIFKKLPKFAGRFEGLEQDKKVLKDKIEQGKSGSEVQISSQIRPLF